MPRKSHVTYYDLLQEIAIVLLLFVLAVGSFVVSISQTPTPPSDTREVLQARYDALNHQYWRTTDTREMTLILDQLDQVDAKLTALNIARLDANTNVFLRLYGQITATTGQGSYATFRMHDAAVLNDLTWTPGATGTTPQATLCSKSFHTGTVRNVPESMKQRVCRNYGIARADCTGKKYEIDHLISLELGGSNDEANLWPQPYFPKPGAKEKDVVENYLHRKVCAGRLTLAEAQHEISTDWYQVYLDINAAGGSR
jgi:hypothetical protein